METIRFLKLYKMKNLFVIACLFCLISCSVQTEIRDVKLAESPKYPRLEYAGVVQSSQFFGNSESNATFIMTDLLSVSIVGKYEIPKGTKCYIVWDETELVSKATFYWDGEKEPHKIVRK
jgi:hypothetical protein